MSATIFRELLSMKTDQVERPRALPHGHYMGTVKTHEFGRSRTKQTPQVQFILQPEEATPDVDVARLEGLDLSKKELRKTFYLTPASLYRLTDQLNAILGIQEGLSFDERLPSTRGVRVMFAVTERDNEEGTETYNDVGAIVAA